MTDDKSPRTRDLYDALNELRLALNGDSSPVSQCLQQFIWFRDNSDKGDNCTYARKSRALFDRQNKEEVLSLIQRIHSAINFTEEGE